MTIGDRMRNLYEFMLETRGDGFCGCSSCVGYVEDHCEAIGVELIGLMRWDNE